MAVLDHALSKTRFLLKQVWGYDSFLPLQEEAVTAILNRQDSVVILPTGGGKSLCFQLPVLLMDGMVVVVSPLVSLMKDQVDSLRGLGIAAGCLNSSLDTDTRGEVIRNIEHGHYKLLYVAPERFANSDFVALLQRCRLAYFVIDEAHCISQWGHDFRPDYRTLGRLREWFPVVGIHAFTATATQPVRRDIREALQLKDVRLLVGSFDRPNLFYRVQRRTDTLAQVCDIIGRHPGEAGIIYCIRRADVDDLAQALSAKGFQVLPYHAGLSDAERQQNQDAFMTEQVDIVVATVAFGMGIDRSDIRYVIHTGMPKSVEHYQQEAGRAGRDRLEAECTLLFSGGDVGKWRSIMGDATSEVDGHALEKLYEMYHYCQRPVCRHRFLVEYFGQAFEKDNCGQCDYCKGECPVMADSKIVAQKILSCVARVKERFGSHHVAQVLKGGNTEKIRQFGHDQLSTFGLLSQYRQRDIVNWAEELVYQGFLFKDPQYATLMLTADGKRLLKGEGEVSLAEPATRGKDKPEKADSVMAGMDKGLFEAFRALRRRIAREKGVPPYIIFSDASLREMARLKPTTLSGFRQIKGVGAQKLQELCPQFLAVIQQHAASAEDMLDWVGHEQKVNTKTLALAMFENGASFSEVLEATGRTHDTVINYCCEYLQQKGILGPEPWVGQSTYQAVCQAFLRLGTAKLKPVYEYLQETVTYGEIKLCKVLLDNALKANILASP